MNILDELLDAKIISIIRGVSSEYVLPTAAALERGGVQFVEVTYKPEDEAACADTLKSIRLLKQQYSEKMHIGAGTVLTVRQVEDAAEAGAEFIISPNTNTAVIQRTKELHLISIPGAYTPTEAEAAWEAGADFIKIFPADTLGPAYFKAVMSSLSHLRLIATGGVSEKNIESFMAVGVNGFGIGSNLVSADRINRGAWAEIEKDALFYTSAVKKYK